MSSKLKKYKICRRLGANIYEKCQTQTFAARSERKAANAPRRRGRMSDYGKQLIEKQKVRFMYGVAEKQFARYVREATDAPRGTTPADELHRLLEIRLDNIIYRAGFAKTRQMSRQMAAHGHFLVNGKRTTTPSYRIKEGDTITVREGSKSSPMFTSLTDEGADVQKAPAWLNVDLAKLSIGVTGAPRDPDHMLQFQTVIEFYTR